MSDETQTYTILHADHPGGEDDFKVFNNEPAANKGWNDLMNNALEASVEHGRAFTLRQYTVELAAGINPNTIDAKGLVDDESATQTKWSRIRPPANFSKLIKTSGPGVVTKAIIDQAQKVIDDKAVEFPNWAREEIIQIENTLQELLIALNQGSENTQQIVDELYFDCYVLRGQGGTFGFDMVTTGCAMACTLLRGVKSVRASDIESLGVILDGIKLILRQPELKDDEAVCNALTQGFSEVVTKALNNKKKN